MVHRLTTDLRTSYRRWSTRPIWASCLFLLIGSLISSGPLACFVHCIVTGEPHHTHAAYHSDHHHGDYGSTISGGHDQVFIVNERGDHALCLYVMSQSSESVPSALTIGVVLTTTLIFLTIVVALRRPDLKPLIRLIALPPPPDPPRTANSFISVM